MLRRTLAATAMISIAACGTDKDVKVDQVTITPPPQKVVATVESNGGLSGSVAAPQPVSFDAADKAFAEKRYSDAKQLFSAYVEQKPANAWGHYMLGLSSWKAGDLTVARTALERALELDPKHVKSRLNLGRVLLEQNLPVEARKHISVAVALDSTSSEAHRLMGRVYSALKQHDEAVVSFRVALSYEPEDAWSMNNMALIMIQQQRFEEAVAPLARAVQLNSNVAVFQNNLGIALEHIGQYTLATKAYRGAVAADVNYTKAVTSLARVEGRKEDLDLVPMDLVAIAQAFDNDVRTVPVSSIVVKKL